MEQVMSNGASVVCQPMVRFDGAEFAPSSTQVEVIRALAHNGKMILAIKFVRDLKGFGLLEAKKMVEAVMEIENHHNDPWKRGW